MRWQAAMSWRRRVDAALVGSGVRFNEWLVLAATRRLVRETGDDVSQNQVAIRLQISRMSITNAMRSLDHLGLVSRGEAMSGPAWRVFVTREGIQFLREHAASIEAASAEA
jgi:DNA-binding MarR family transcriptional regulator